MTQSAFLLDLGRCIGCQACVVACKHGNELPAGAAYIEITERTTGTFPDVRGGFDNHRCYHCTDAGCVAVCPTDALSRKDGLTLLDRSACSGCGYCVQACPFGVPTMVEGRAAKCDGCADEVAAGGTPWCVATCPSDALAFGERTEIAAEAHRRVEAMRARYPDARVYGEAQAGGLGMLVVTPDDPQALGLPLDPKPPAVTGLWQKVVQPGAIGLTAATAAAAGVAAVIARRNHMAELARLGMEEDSDGDA